MAALSFATPSLAADRPIEISGEAIVDAVGNLAGGQDRDVRLLSNVSISGEVDLAALGLWDDARAHVELLDNRGGRPNDGSATLQGVDNIEVPKPGLRLFEAWVEHDLPGGSSLRAGLYDVNSEFYTNDSASLLLAPPFGIGSELAATGPNGPSIFPSTALAVRAFVPLDRNGAYLRAAAINARASTLGDDTGVDFSFKDGLLLIAEAGGAAQRLRWLLGGWAYTHNPDNIYETKPDGSAMHRASYGAYAVLERDLRASGNSLLTMFVRLGLSDPHTTPYQGSVQAGLYMSPAWPGRESSRVSLGLAHAFVNDHFRALQRSENREPANETTLELTFSDQLFNNLAIQPDLQWVRHPGGLADSPAVLVAALRCIWSF
jgi:porin